MIYYKVTFKGINELVVKECDLSEAAQKFGEILKLEKAIDFQVFESTLKCQNLINLISPPYRTVIPQFGQTLITCTNGGGITT